MSKGFDTKGHILRIFVNSLLLEGPKQEKTVIHRSLLSMPLIRQKAGDIQVKDAPVLERCQGRAFPMAHMDIPLRQAYNLSIRFHG